MATSKSVPSVGGVSAAHATGALVIGALILLIFIRHGWRGVSVAGVNVGIR